MDFGILNLSKNEIFLRFNWLKYHNPKVDWKASKIEFSQCPVGVAQSGTPAQSTRLIP
ncbi:hypothetical protein AMATHDRAFT_9767 [Amanita thiersii Skay4041]|uniref:Uncharacterized protein n=1 Tax=Amanita thiersii Skay4041 TaxID=703135 RepID=A0A2A9NAD5_9AGAR|nr:hypothetical protein AMATHDRAFT_9767 [Amanita thiersii Skay4041]